MRAWVAIGVAALWAGCATVRADAQKRALPLAAFLLRCAPRDLSVHYLPCGPDDLSSSALRPCTLGVTGCGRQALLVWRGANWEAEHPCAVAAAPDGFDASDDPASWWPTEKLAPLSVPGYRVLPTGSPPPIP